MLSRHVLHQVLLGAAGRVTLLTLVRRLCLVLLFLLLLKVGVEVPELEAAEAHVVLHDGDAALADVLPLVGHHPVGAGVALRAGPGLAPHAGHSLHLLLPHVVVGVGSEAAHLGDPHHDHLPEPRGVEPGHPGVLRLAAQQGGPGRPQLRRLRLPQVADILGDSGSQEEFGVNWPASGGMAKFFNALIPDSDPPGGSLPHTTLKLPTSTVYFFPSGKHSYKKKFL